MKDMLIRREENEKAIADKRSHLTFTYKGKQLKHKKNTKNGL
jgi:hypothetical protein